MFELFKVPAGTKIDKLPDGRLLFSPPDGDPFTVHTEADMESAYGIRVVKIYSAPDCKTEITVGYEPH